MHTIIYFVLISTSLISFPIFTFAPTSQVNEPSALKIVTEKIRILSRLVNAISLQASSIRNDTDINDALSELFEIPSNGLSLIQKVKVKKIKVALQQLSNLASLQIFLPVKKETIDIMNRVLSSFMTFLFHHEKIEEMKKLDPLLVHKKIKELQNSTIVKTNCTDLNVDIIRQFGNMIGQKNREKHMLPSDNKIAEIINTFFGQWNEVSDCLKSLSTIRDILEVSTVWDYDDNYRPILAYINDLKDILMYSIQNIPPKLHEISSGVETSKPVWQWSLNQEEIVETFENMRNIFEIDWIYGYSSLPYLTAGFEYAKDLVRVQDDLKSSWFQKEFVKAGNVTELSEALLVFENVSRTIMEFESKWKNLTKYLKSKDSGLLKASRSLFSVSQFGRNVSYNQNFQKSKNIFEQCWGHAKDIHNFSNFGVFEREYQPVKSILDSLRLFRQQSSFLSNNSATSTAAVQRIDNMMKSFSNKYDQITSVFSLKAIHIFEREYNIYKTDTPGFLNSIVETLNHLKNSKQGIEHLDMNMTFSLEDFLTKTNFLNVSKCMREHNFDQDGLTNATRMLRAILEFPDSKKIQEMNGYLDNVQLVQDHLETLKTVKSVVSRNITLNGSNILLKLNNSKVLTESLGLSLKSLNYLDEIHKHRDDLTYFPDFSDSQVQSILFKTKLIEWMEAGAKTSDMVEAADKVNEIAENVRNRSLEELMKIFDEASKVRGISGSRRALETAVEMLTQLGTPNTVEAAENLRNIANLNMDFTKHQSRLKGIRVTVASLRRYFNEIFGPHKWPEKTNNNTKTLTVEKKVDVEKPIPWILIICFGSFLILLFIFASVVIYGLTPSGRTKFTNSYLYYFGRPEDFEKRWRYSLFRDKLDGKNALLDATREVNKTNMIKALRRGVYVNVYNNYGNTALHVAAKRGYPELVEILIRHGANRSLLNTKNKTPEQLIPLDFRDAHPDKADNFLKVQQVFKKLENKKFRNRVPESFPSSSFHIYVEDRTDDRLTNRFMEKYQHITSNEAMSTTTHCIVKTNEEGMLETDSIDLLSWVFNGVIIVKEEWMIDCLKNDYIIEEDFKYLVEKVKFKGSVYDAVLPWSNAMAKGEIPFLYGVYVAVIMNHCENLVALASLITFHGGVMMESFPKRDQFNPGSRSYLHANRGPIFLIHDGTIDLTEYRKDKQKMYTLFTEDEFIVFMLQRKIERDRREEPISVLKAVREKK